MRHLSTQQWFFYILLASMILYVVLVFGLGLARYYAWQLSLGIVVFALYGFDKAQAICIRQRVPENVLHLCHIAGGGALALFAMATFRHKTHKFALPISALFSACVHGYGFYVLYKKDWSSAALWPLNYLSQYLTF